MVTVNDVKTRIVNDKPLADTIYYATLVREYGWDMSFLAVQSLYGERYAARLDAHYTRYIKGLS